MDGGYRADGPAQLRAQQFSEANGWTSDYPAYGGWGMGGAIRRPPDAGHVDLSMTRFVLEALRASGVDGSDRAMTRARGFSSGHRITTADSSSHRTRAPQ